MSPTVVVAWISRAGVPPVLLSALRMRPIVVPASRAVQVPAATPTVIAPDWVRRTTVPRVASFA
jgi:hypothetical protein